MFEAEDTSSKPAYFGIFLVFGGVDLLVWWLEKNITFLLYGGLLMVICDGETSNITFNKQTYIPRTQLTSIFEG